MAVIDEMILKFLNKKLNSDFQRINQDKANFIELYYLNQMSANYKQDEKQLKEILNKNVSPANTDSKIKLTIYYKNRKLSNLFILNNTHRKEQSVADQHHCVYQYVCNRDGCNAAQTYIGFTTCSIATRFRYHTQNSSSIKKHLKGVHNIDKVATADLIPNVSIVKYSSDKRDLMFYEALLIRENKPTLNSQVEFSDKILKIFKH